MSTETRHHFTPVSQSPREVRERELREAKREVERLTHKCDALQATLRMIDRLASPYVNGRKPEPRR